MQLWGEVAHSAWMSIISMELIDQPLWATVMPAHLIVWPASVMGWYSWCGGEQGVSHNVWMKVKWHEGKRAVCTLCVRLHTSVCEKPCFRKTQAGPTMLCSMLQFFTSAPKGSLNSLSSPSWSSSPCGCRPCRPTALTFPSTTPFRGRPGRYSTTHTLSAWLISSHKT